MHRLSPSCPLLSDSLPSPYQYYQLRLTLSESRPLNETATSERSEDYSLSRTVDTVSETASCTALDLSEIPPSLRLQVNPVPDASPPLPVTSAPTLSSLRNSSSSPDSGNFLPLQTLVCLKALSLSFLLLLWHKVLWMYLVTIPLDWNSQLKYSPSHVLLS